MALATLSIDLEAKLANFEQGMQQAARVADRRAEEIQGALDGIKETALGLGGAIAGAFSLGAITTFVQSTVDAIDALNEVADATGDSIENLSALENVARLTGGGIDQVAGVLIKLNATLKEAEPNSPMANALGAIGLNAEELRRAAPSEALRQVAGALDQYADSGDKARLVQRLFGESVRESAGFLKDLAEKGDVVATVTKEQADEADRYNKEMFKLQTTIGDVARSLTMTLVPALNAVTEKMREEGFLSLFGFGKEFKAKKELAAYAAEVVELDGHLKKLKIDQAEGIGYFGNPEKVARQIENVTRLLEKAKKDFKAAERDYLGLNDGAAGGGRGFVHPAPVKPVLTDLKLEDQPQPPPRAAKTYSRPGTDLGFNFEPVSAAQKRALQLLQDNDLTAAREYAETLELLQHSLFEVTAEEIPAVEAAIAKLTGTHQAAAEGTSAFAKAQERLAQLLGATASAELERQRQDMQLLAQAFEDGRISAEAFTEAAQTRLGTLPETIKASTDAMTAFADEAARNIQDALGDTLTKTLEGDFDSIGDMWKSLLVRMAAEAIAADIGQSLFGKGGQGGGWIGQLFNVIGGVAANAKGNAFASTGVQAFAQGDVFSRPTLFQFAQGAGFSLGVMGEAGPEAVMPLKRGKDGRLGVSLQGGGSQGAVVITNHYTFGAGVNRTELAAWGEQVRARTLADVHRSRNREGNLS